MTPDESYQLESLKLQVAHLEMRLNEMTLRVSRDQLETHRALKLLHEMVAKLSAFIPGYAKFKGPTKAKAPATP